ncbi:MAG: hypothetical protein ACXACP_11515 [Candidatus Hodarchaeales archaeon]|jgi:hypothetical protein
MIEGIDELTNKIKAFIETDKCRASNSLFKVFKISFHDHNLFRDHNSLSEVIKRLKPSAMWNDD